jgi:hypothetical protein
MPISRLFSIKSSHNRKVKIRLIKHEEVPGCGSYELRFPGGKPSKYFYFENIPPCRLRPDLVEGAVGRASGQDIRQGRAAQTRSREANIAMDEDAIKLFATIAALKLIVGRLWGFAYKNANLTPEQILEMHDKLLEDLPKQALAVTGDAALSDHLSAEIETQIKEILRGVEVDLGVERKRS